MVDREMVDNPIGEDQTIEVEEMDFKIGMEEGQAFRIGMNSMNEEECEDECDNDMDDEELFMCCVSEFQENTGLEVVPYEESN